ncbi:MAG TPA: SCO family protein [Candidatus Rubrimentiphilum sp.]|nr:SCO family protein [Candidatus Rubrimentiphilum sp.]
MFLIAAIIFSVALAPVIPAHGTVLAVTPRGTIIRNDPVTAMMPSLTRLYRVAPHLDLAPGVGIDGFIDRSRLPWHWYDAAIAGAFVAGLPDTGKVVPVDLGSQLPAATLVDQRGRLIQLGRDFHGKVTLTSFIYTRCTNECPVISGKYAAMQRLLDARHFHLIEITIDPTYDSPAVLAAYARRFGVEARSWSLLTGQPHEIAHLLDRFGISSLKTGAATILHNDRLFLSASDGKVAQIVQTSGFTPSSMAAQARHVAGMVSNPFGRFELWLIASVTALCGGNQFAGIVALETMLFILIAGISFVALGWAVRKIWGNA